MAKNGKKQLRALWLQVHKWIGLTLAVLIIPISLTGSALVWHDWLDAKLEPQRFATLGPAALPAFSLCDGRARRARPTANASPSSASRRKAHRSSQSRPSLRKAEAARSATSLWIDPRDASVIDRAIGQQRRGAGHARPPRQPDGTRLGPHDRRLGRSLHVRLLPHRHLAVVAAERKCDDPASAGSAATRPTRTFIICPASGSCSRWRCCPSPAPGSASPKSSRQFESRPRASRAKPRAGDACQAARSHRDER